MRAKTITSTSIVILFGLLILALAACGSDSDSVASQTDDPIGDAPIVGDVEEIHDDGDDHAVGAVEDEHADDDHAVAIEDEHADDDHAVAIEDEHADNDHAVAIEDEHADDEHEVTAHLHADMTGPVDPDAAVTHITAAEFVYGTAAFEVEAGEPFSVQISNQGMLEHDITIEGFESEFGLHVLPGEDNIATYAMHDAGEYTYYCTVLGHREAGMTGTLVVAAGHDQSDGHHDADEVMSEDADDKHDEGDTSHDADDGHHDDDTPEA